MAELTLFIEGMSCGHCLNAVKRALSQLKGVDIRSLQIGRAQVGYDPAQVDPAAIVAAVKAAGYPASARAA